ncbi:hypothetical protein [Micromonospora sp. DT229]
MSERGGRAGADSGAADEDEQSSGHPDPVLRPGADRSGSAALRQGGVPA